MQWIEYRSTNQPKDIVRAWAYMLEGTVTALGSVFEMDTGEFKTAMSLLDQKQPLIGGPFLSLADAQRHVQAQTHAKLIRPRTGIIEGNQ